MFRLRYDLRTLQIFEGYIYVTYDRIDCKALCCSQDRLHLVLVSVGECRSKAINGVVPSSPPSGSFHHVTVRLWDVPIGSSRFTSTQRIFRVSRSPLF